MRDIKRNLGEHEDYNPLSLSKIPHDHLAAEYTRMREAMRKNVSRIRKSGEFNDAAVLDTYKEFQPASQLNQLELAKSLSRLESTLSYNTSTLTGLKRQRAMAIETLKDRGYSGINKKNYKDFIRYMEATRSIATSIMRYRYTRRGTATGEDRNKRLELFDAAQRKGISTNALIRDFRFYTKHADEIEKLPDRAGGRKLGTKKVRKLLKGES